MTKELTLAEIFQGAIDMQNALAQKIGIPTKYLITQAGKIFIEKGKDISQAKDDMIKELSGDNKDEQGNIKVPDDKMTQFLADYKKLLDTKETVDCPGFKMEWFKDMVTDVNFPILFEFVLPETAEAKA